ncbi:ADP-ribosyltransferase [Phreatobacter sp. HK31-P]
MGGWYTVFKRIKGHLYAYSQRSWRDGKKVRVESRYIGGSGGATTLASLAEAARGNKLTLRQDPALKLATLPPAKAEALFYANKLVELQIDDLPKQSGDALLGYTGRDYRPLNEALRGDIPLTPALKQQILWIKKALQDPRAVMLHDVVLHRAALIRFDQLALGGTFIEPGFMSCSVSREVAYGWGKVMQVAKPFYEKVLLKIIVRKGERGFVSLNDVNPGEEDEVLCIGSQMRILELEKTRRGWTATVERVTISR